MEIFGYNIQKKFKSDARADSPISPASDDGSTIISTGQGTGAAYYGYSYAGDFDGTLKNESDLIRRYRDTAAYPDCDSAIEDVVNEAINTDEDEQIVTLALDKLKIGDNVKEKLTAEFETVLKLLKFEDRAHEIFKQWYIDGRIYYHTVVDKSRLKDGIQELRFVDPRKIRKIKNVQKEKNANGIEVIKSIEEYYLYNEKGVAEGTAQGIKMAPESVVLVGSGNLDPNTGVSFSYLHKAIKPVNQLRMLEDAMVIYRITRAPERRIFYVDVGNLPKQKAEQYVQDIMNKFKNKIVYDASTGEVRDDRKFTSMMEDFWMPRREGGKGTEITTLPGLQNTNNTEDVQYFQTKLFQSLNVPMTRLTPGTPFSAGRGSEITRDEIKFTKFICRIRRRFSQLLSELFKMQLLLKGIVSQDDWLEIKDNIKFVFAHDDHFAEFKNNEILTQRVTLLQLADPFVGKYYSIDWVKQNVLMLNEDQIKADTKQMEKEKQLMADIATQQGNIAQLQNGPQQGEA